VKTAWLIALISIPFLFACHPKRPEIPGTEAPAGPLLQVLAQQRSLFHSMKAIAGVDAVRRGRKQSFDTVGIVLDGQRRLRMEAFGPLGQSLLALVWDGRDVLLRLPDDDRIMTPGQDGLDRVLGMHLEARELCAVLAGNAPEPPLPGSAKAFCVPNSACVVEAVEGGDVRRIHLLPSPNASGAIPFRIGVQERYHGDDLLYRVRYDGQTESAGVLLPRTVAIEGPGRTSVLTITYQEADANLPLTDELFVLTNS
jgi:hypothetical protein